MRTFIIDAFTDRAFAGNPAAVCLIDSPAWPDVRWMQHVASEFNLSETAFARQLPADEEADWALRWFSPRVEVALCGHATLATAHALRETHGITGKTTFASLHSGFLRTETGSDGSITLDFPAAELKPTSAPPGLGEALGAEPEEVWDTGKLGDFLVKLHSETTVRGATPHLEAIAEITDTRDARGVIITASAIAPESMHDYVSRFFHPSIGISEDPVTGSAHTALAPFWSKRLARDELLGLQCSERSGLVRTRVASDRVALSGHAVTVMEGKVRV